MDDPRRWRGLLAISVAMFVAATDMTITGVALPDISQDLNADISELQWVVDAFLVTLAGLLLAGSGLADRFGRRRVFLLGFAGFAAASALAAAAQTPEQLIGARVLMGAATACVLPPALSLITVMFSTQERPRAIGIWSTAAGLGAGLGPTLGGLLVGAFGWPAVFLINVPAALLAVPAGIALLPESRRPGVPPLDLVGVGLSILGLGGIVFALIESAEAGLGDPLVLSAAATGLGALALFVVLELRQRHPLFDVRVVAWPAVTRGTIAIGAIYASFLGMLFLLPQYLQYVQNRSALVAGLLIAPFGLALGIVSPRTDAIAKRIGADRAVVIGVASMAAGIGALAAVLGAATPIGLVGVLVFAIGSGFALTISPATAVIMEAVGADKAGDGAAVNQLARQVGAALGVAIIGSLFAVLYADDVRDRFAHLSAADRGLADESIEGASTVAGKLGGDAGAEVLAQAADAFDDAARIGLWFAAAMLALAAIVAAFGLRGGRRRRQV